MTQLPSWGAAQRHDELASATPPPQNVVVIVDGPDPDNYAAALAATSSEFGLNVAAVIMTGRPVNPDHRAKPYEADLAASQAVRHDNAIRMNDLLVRHGRKNIPVFEGGIAPYSTIPHRVHIDEHVLDVEPALPDTRLAGGINDAVAHLKHLPGTIHVVCGGPLTDAAVLMKNPKIKEKLGVLTAQLGMFGGGGVKTMAGGRRQFNVLADSDAAREVLADYPSPMYLVPTDVTKRDEFAFSSPQDLAALAQSPAFTQLAKMYERAWPLMWEPRKEKIYAHDFHPAEVMALLANSAAPPHKISSEQPQEVGRYTFSRIGIEHVPSPGPTNDRSEEGRWGEIDLKSSPDPRGPVRLLATDVNADPVLHRQILAGALNSPAARQPTSPGPRVRKMGPSFDNFAPGRPQAPTDNEGLGRSPR